MSLGKNVRRIRNEKGFSMMQLRERTGLSKSTISDIENDKSSPTMETIEKIAEAFGASTDRLLGKSIVNIIETRLEELNLTLDELAEKTKLPVTYFEGLGNIMPGGYDYDNMKTIAKVLNMQPGVLRAALARQEPPAYGGDDFPSSPEDDFGDTLFTRGEPEFDEFLEHLHKRPEMKMLFSATKNATKEDIEQAVKIINALKGE